MAQQAKQLSCKDVAQSFLLAVSIFGLDQYVRLVIRKLKDNRQ